MSRRTMQKNTHTHTCIHHYIRTRLCMHSAKTALPPNLSLYFLPPLILLAPRKKITHAYIQIFMLPLPVLDVLRPFLTTAYKKASYDVYDSCACKSLKKENFKLCQSNPMHMIQAYFRQFQWVETRTIRKIQTPCIVVHGLTDR